MKTIILSIFILSSLECYSQMQIIDIPKTETDTTIKDNPWYWGVVIHMRNTTCIEGSDVTLTAYHSIHIYPETIIQGTLHAYLIPWKREIPPTEVIIWGRKMLIKNGRKYMKI
jgi:hypothetical protein